jgi:Xaa-Pro aminopeptidase
MITMTNVLKKGRTVWDSALLPIDEYVERTRVLREAMARDGLDVLVSLGHATRPGNFAYLSGYVPPLGWMGTVLGTEQDAEQGPMLVSGGGPRETPFVKTQTWIEDLRTSRSLFMGPAEVVAAAVGEIAEAGARVGVAGAHDALNIATRDELTEVLSAYATVEADELMASIRALKRPREIIALRQATQIARGAVEAGVERFAAGDSAAEAGLATERAARIAGCRDVRVLCDLGNGELAPVEELSPERGERFTIYCAVEHLSYWGQATLSSAPSPLASAAIEAMLVAAVAGTDSGAVASAAISAMPERAAGVALSYGLGGGIGLDPSERPEITAAGGTTLAPGMVLGLQVIAPEDGGLGSAAETILVTEDGPTRW